MTDWNRMPEFEAHYIAPYDCGRVLLYVVSPNPGEGHVYPARWAIPYEGAPYSQCFWEANLSSVPGRSVIVKEFVTHWAPWPEAPADAEDAIRETVERFKNENARIVARAGRAETTGITVSATVDLGDGKPTLVTGTVDAIRPGQILRDIQVAPGEPRN